MNYHDITHDDMNNGDGLRVVLWLSGCSHHCYNCQNPQTWSPESGIEFNKYSSEEIYSELAKDYISGITFTGGDPLHKNNIIGVLELVNKIRSLYSHKTIWLYTGYTIDAFLYMNNTNGNDLKRRDIISKCDVVVDGKYIDALRDTTLKWRGSTNQRVIDIHKSKKYGEIILWAD